MLGVEHAAWIVKLFVGGKAEQVVVSLGRVLILKVAVVGTHHLDAIFLGKFKYHFVGTLLQRECFAIGTLMRILHLVALNLQIVVFAKHTPIPLYGLSGPLNVTIQYLGGHLTCNTRRADNQALMVFFQIPTVGSWLEIKAIDPRATNQLY